LTDARVDAVKRGLEKAGIEVYRVRDTVIEVAERIRFHIMDSGARIVAADPLEVRFSARSQRSGNPDLDDESLFGLVRSALADVARARGFSEAGTASERVMDPVDPNRMLDVWYEVRFARQVASVDEAVDLVRWVLSVERFVGTSAPPDGVAY
jgi:hypothetical protein